MGGISGIGGGSIQKMAANFMRELSALEGSGQGNAAQGSKGADQLLNDLMQMISSLDGQVSSRAAPTHVAW